MNKQVLNTPTRSTTSLMRAHWPIQLAWLLLGAIYFLVSNRTSLVPNWLILTMNVIAFIAIVLSRRQGRTELSHSIALMLTALLTLMVVVSAGLLLYQLLDGRPSAPELLRDAALVWVANVLTFALWYWEIDGGGPTLRHQHPFYQSDDFAFPQVTLGRHDDDKWMPHFIDYLFLAFNTSTAFSPTDTMVLSRRAKLLTMTQALLALIVTAVLVARAINTLPT